MNNGEERKMTMFINVDALSELVGEPIEVFLGRLDLKLPPTVEAEPVRHGRWIFIRMDDNENGLYECSECHRGETHCPHVEVKYCWNCGARMDGERKEE